MALRGVEPGAVTKTHKKTVYKALDQQRMKGRLRSHSDGHGLSWEIMPPAASSLSNSD